jgi:hypothetical protein
LTSDLVTACASPKSNGSAVTTKCSGTSARSTAIECEPLPRMPRMPCQSSSIVQSSRGTVTSTRGGSSATVPLRSARRAWATKWVENGAPEQ